MDSKLKADDSLKQAAVITKCVIVFCSLCINLIYYSNTATKLVCSQRTSYNKASISFLPSLLFCVILIVDLFRIPSL